MLSISSKKQKKKTGLYKTLTATIPFNIDFNAKPKFLEKLIFHERFRLSESLLRYVTRLSVFPSAGGGGVEQSRKPSDIAI